MTFQGSEDYLQRMAEVGVAPLDNQSLANSLDRGFESVSLAGRLQGRETLIEKALSESLPEPEAAPKTPRTDDQYAITTKLPGLT